MGTPALHETRSFTYGDYLTWPEDERWEIIDGVPYNVTPAPNDVHQAVLFEFSRQLGNYLQGKDCQGYSAPFDVRLPAPGETRETTTSVVQPDLMVVCDLSKIRDGVCNGAPDFILEVLSPSTAVKDQKQKRDLYARSGVREYWILHPTDRVLYIHTEPVSGTFAKGRTEAVSGQIAVEVLPGFVVDFNLIFPSNLKAAADRLPPPSI